MLSPTTLPRGCSTTELRQQNAGRDRRGANAAETAITAPVGARQCRNLRESYSPSIMPPMARDKTDKKPPKTQRSERLAAALRANLQRRKAQLRGRDERKEPRCRQDRARLRVRLSPYFPGEGGNPPRELTLQEGARRVIDRVYSELVTGGATWIEFVLSAASV